MLQDVIRAGHLGGQPETGTGLWGEFCAVTWLQTGAESQRVGINAVTVKARCETS